MNYERGFKNPQHGSRNSWIPAKPVLPEYGIGRNLGETPGRPILVDDGIIETESWVRGAPAKGNTSWTPVTPRKPVPARSNLIPVENQPENGNWEDLVGIYQDLLKEDTPNLNVVPDPYPNVQNNRNQNWVASSVKNLNPIPSQSPSSGSGSGLGPKYFPLEDTANWDSNLLAAIVQPNRSSTSVPFVGTQNNSVHRTMVPNSSTQVGSNSVRPSCMLGNQQSQTFTSSNMNSGYNSKQSPIDGFPIPYRPCYNLNSPPRSELDAASSSITSPFPFAPVTPNTQQRQRVPENNICENERNDDVDKHYNNEVLPAIGDSTSSVVSTTRKEPLERDETGIDLNKTPQQKIPSRRKKHRPKVIREGKAKKTPNPKEPKTDTPVKRKYVRKKGINISENQEINGDKVPQRSGKRKYVRKKGSEEVKAPSVETPVKTCKKQLDFDLECDARNESLEKGINLNADPRDIEQERRINGVLERAAMKNAQNNNYISVNTHLESSVNRIQSGTHNARNHALNVLARNLTMRNSVSGQSFMQMNPYNNNLDERRGVKRQSFEQMNNRNLNAMDSLLMYQKLLLGADDSKDLAAILFENHKKTKTQSDLQAFEDNSRGEARRMNGVYGNVSALELLNSCTGRMNQRYGRFKPPAGAAQNLQNRPVPSGVQPVMGRLQRYGQGHGVSHGTAMVRWNMPPATPPKDYSRSAVVAYPAAPFDKKQTVMLNLSNQRLNGADKMVTQVHQQSLTKARGGPRKPKFEVSVEDITGMLEGMCIYDEKEKRQNALVPYRGNNNAIIPFEPIKKRKPRPKVDLDPETDRLWRLLMGKEGSEGTETLDKDKEKWWEDERRVFRGRADSFIARMHLVQGDRRFSRWKGSVVDSVIGVFLTQNVSDHLSSSAFMSLAAKFSIKSKTTNEARCRDGACVLVEEPINTILPNDRINNNIGRRPLFNQTSFVSCELSHISSTKAAANKQNRTEEEVILSQDSLDSSTIQTVDEIRSSSASNSETEDHETSKEPGQAEKVSMFTELFSNDNWNMPLNDQFHSEIPIISFNSLPSSNSRMTEAYHTSNLTYQQNEMPRFQYDFLRNNPTHEEKFQPGPQMAKNGAQKHNSCAEDRVSGVDKQNGVENAAAEANSKEQNSGSKARKGTVEDEKKKEFDWDSLRKDVFLNGGKRERSKDAKDSLDYEALRRAQVNEISDAIRERGMNNLLADRIKGFLDRLVKDHGSIDLEWLRDVPPDKAKDYLLSIRGLGLKSVECVRLLTLHHLAFPVDTNVGRIAVRLGWVPLQPLPESLQLHLLEMYPVLESIQKYLWPRLCKLDQLTLYELHYQMITFGKVFCTKSKPNCNACPMRAECRHFASAFASARLALPGPEDKRIVTSDAPIATNITPPVTNRPMSLPPAENNYTKDGGFLGRQCEPIIEEPSTPEPEHAELSISDIEEQYYDDSDEIPTIKLDMEEFTTNLQKMQDGDMSKALVALNPQAASIPTPKLKNVSRLRTEHQVYELPDSHPILEGLDKREPDDPSPYLLAIWTPGETANSIQPPERGCPSQESGKLCDRTTCFSCNCIKEANSQVVRGTILMPCRTAMQGSFPLNGTYFQVNEMFADHASSLNPIDVPRAWIWNLPRRTVYFGTSVSTIFKGLTTEEIQYCFWRGFVCVRGFDQKTRAPRPLMARLHFPASKLVKTKNEGKEGK